jgi:signal transduction histidine kinase
MKVLNSINDTNIDEYLLDSLEQCLNIDDFCGNCYRLLSDYIDIKNFILYDNKKEAINLIYQHKFSDTKRINYSLAIELITKKYSPISQVYIDKEDYFSVFDNHCYYQWLKQEKINFLFLSSLKFKGELLGNLFIEIKNFKYSQVNVQNILKIVNKFLAIYAYHQQSEIKEEKLILEATKLVKAKQEQSKYLSHMNHELRTPIAAVIGFAKMLQQRMYGGLNVKQAQYVDAIYQSGTYLLELINDLLDVSKIQAQKEELLIEKTLVRELCESALSLVKTKAEEQGLELNLVVQPDIQSCLVDQRRLKQVLVNLLSNAVKFTEKGSVTLEVEKDDQYIYFHVIDTGIGVDAQSQSKLFQPFSQLNTHLHRKHKGTGLGLVISRELVRLHGGDITLKSEKNKGSCFTVYIPHHQVDQD